MCCSKSIWCCTVFMLARNRAIQHIPESMFYFQLNDVSHFSFLRCPVPPKSISHVASTHFTSRTGWNRFSYTSGRMNITVRSNLDLRNNWKWDVPYYLQSRFRTIEVFMDDSNLEVNDMTPQSWKNSKRTIVQKRPEHFCLFLICNHISQQFGIYN